MKERQVLDWRIIWRKKKIYEYDFDDTYRRGM